MDYSYGKTYGVEDIDPKKYFDQYFSPNVPAEIYHESTICPMKAFHNAFSRGLVKGDTMIDFRQGPTIPHLLAIKDFVKKLFLIELNAKGLTAIREWLNKGPNRSDWSRAKESLKELKGHGNRSYGNESEDEEENLRGKIVSTSLFTKDAFGESSNLPKVDIVASMWFLETASPTHEDLKSNLKMMNKLLNKDGQLLLYGSINASYFQVGENKCPLLKSDESTYRKALNEGGFKVVHLEKFTRVMSPDIVNHESVGFFICQKVKDV